MYSPTSAMHIQASVSYSLANRGKTTGQNNGVDAFGYNSVE